MELGRAGVGGGGLEVGWGWLMVVVEVRGRVGESGWGRCCGEGERGE